MKVHFIAIGGSAMHNLAIALSKKGYNVSGSDDEIFEPSRSRLEKHNLLPDKIGWDSGHITEDLDFVVLGMHARSDNPELLRAQEMGLKVVSYPEFLYEQSKDKTRVVIAGSHGKTTITAMILHVLHFHKIECDYMVGAQLQGFDTMVKLTNENEFILLEGDEYLSSPVDRRPKFLHYHPNICLISGIAWDHANVFPTYEDYLQQFALLLDSVEPGGAVIYNELDADLRKLVLETSNEVKKFAYTIPEYTTENGRVLLYSPDGEVPLEIFGKHNMNNLEGARWICNQMGVQDEQFYEAISSFSGASRRLEKLMQKPGLTVFRDFAHAPSKVQATTSAVRESFDGKLLACLELHTFSSLSAGFIESYKNTMGPADVALVYYNPEVMRHKKLPPLLPEDVNNAFGGGVLVFDDIEKLRQRLLQEINMESIVLLMSSGNFDGTDWKQEFKNVEQRKF